MKRISSLVLVGLLVVNVGCTCGQGWGANRSAQPNIFQRMYNVIHPSESNVGAPCMGCGPQAVAPYAGPMVSGTGCDNCDSTRSMGYAPYDDGMSGTFIGPSGSSFGESVYAAPAGR